MTLLCFDRVVVKKYGLQRRDDLPAQKEDGNPDDEQHSDPYLSTSIVKDSMTYVGQKASLGCSCLIYRAPSTHLSKLLAGITMSTASMLLLLLPSTIHTQSYAPGQGANTKRIRETPSMCVFPGAL